MNKLSWMLYAADALDKLSLVLFVLGSLGLIVCLATWAVMAMSADIDKKPKPKAPSPLLAGLIGCLLLACFLPSAKTVYMIAASEAGERIAATAEAREMLDLVRQKLKTVLTDKT